MKLNDSLLEIQKKIFEALNLKYTPAKVELESAEYSACSFSIEGRIVKYRLAKITPTKNGQFVTIWKRSPQGPILPYDRSDRVDFFLAAVKKNDQFGLFIFSKEILIKRGIFSVNCKGGKRALRVYPPWDNTTSKQAKITQQWQLEFFVDMLINEPIDVERCKKLLL